MIQKIDEVKSNTSSENKFIKRFFQWFDGFKVVKFLNYSHSVAYKKLPVENAITQLLIKSGYNNPPEEAEKMLSLFRNIDKNGTNL